MNSNSFEHDSPGASSVPEMLSNAIDTLFSFPEAPSPPADLTELLSLNPNPENALNLLIRYLEEINDDRINATILEMPLLNELLTLFGHSEYFAGVLIRRTYLLSSLFIERRIEDPFMREMAEENLSSILSDSADMLHELRLFKESEYLKIGARSILSYAAFEETVSSLTELAEIVISNALNIARHNLAEAYGRFDDSFCVIGLGKLGGRELNFSSDVDLIYLYDEESAGTRPDGSSYSPFEYYSALSQELTSCLTDNRDNLRMYRVDLRLRPDGDAGPIVRDVPGYDRYYQRSGRTWERQMLLKARIVAGNSESGDKFLKCIEPWIYSKSPEIGYLGEVYRVKTRFERKKDAGRNIKICPGGIRDIEFICQSLQQLFGGAERELRNEGTLETIRILQIKGKLSAREADSLRNSYIFLRNLEHALQYPDNRQTHSIPVEDDSIHELGKRLDYHDVSAFISDIEMHKRSVRALFESIFRHERSDVDADLIFDLKTDEDVALAIAKGLGFSDARQAVKNLRYMAAGHPPYEFPESVRLKFISLWQLLYMSLKRAPDMDLTLNNLEKLISAFRAPGLMYDLFAGQPDMLKILIDISAASTKVTDILASNPQFFDALLQPSQILEMDSLPVLKEQFEREVLYDSDTGTYRNNLWSFLTLRTLILYTWFLLRKQPNSIIQRSLSNCTDIIVSDVLDKLYGSSGARLPLVALSLGKYGSRELGFHSDLDLVFLLAHENGEANPREADAAARLVSEFEKVLSEHSMIPSLYKIDMRLRPEGKDAVLVTTEPQLHDYLNKRAKLFEITALCKLRTVWRSPTASKTVSEKLRNWIFDRGVSKEDLIEIEHYRSKSRLEKLKGDTFHLKWSPGGMTDVEFLSQSLALRHGKAIPPLQNAASTAERLTFLGSEGIIPESDANLLIEAYEFYQTIDQHIFMTFERTDHTLPESREKLDYLSSVSGLDDSDNITDITGYYANIVKGIVDEHITRLKDYL